MATLTQKKEREQDAEAVKAVTDYLDTDEWHKLCDEGVDFKWSNYNFRTVSTEYQDSGRWEENWLAVVQVIHTGGEWSTRKVYVAFDFSVPATESQGGMEDFKDELGTPYVVEPVWKQITVWKKK